jgi:hypothetical protein
MWNVFAHLHGICGMNLCSFMEYVELICASSWKMWNEFLHPHGIFRMNLYSFMKYLECIFTFS